MTPSEFNVILLISGIISTMYVLYTATKEIEHRNTYQAWNDIEPEKKEKVCFYCQTPVTLDINFCNRCGAPYRGVKND